MFGPYELAHGFIKVNNRTAMLEYVELAVHTMVSYGIDGFALDIEGDCYSVLAASATARASWTDFLVTLKARMTESVPGSVRAVTLLHPSKGSVLRMTESVCGVARARWM